jgi:hypothetical protein
MLIYIGTIIDIAFRILEMTKINRKLTSSVKETKFIRADDNEIKELFERNNIKYEETVEKLKNFYNIYEAEKYIRELKISLNDKVTILEKSEIIKKLRKKEKNYKSSLHLNKVNYLEL